MSMKISNRVSENHLQITLNDEVLWVRTPDAYQLLNVDDAMTIATFFPAMSLGGSIEIEGDYHPSKMLCDAQPDLQTIFRGWLPKLHRTCLPKHVEYGQPESRPGVLSLFSGGVDSMHTFLENESRITHLLYIDGYEHSPGGEENRLAIANLRSFAEEFGKELIVVETNSLEFYRRYYLSREVYMGTIAFAIAHLLGFSNLVVPSSCDYQNLVALGTHPWTDPMWSSEAIRIEHHGCESNRLEKVRTICEHGSARHHLLVCHDESSTNCGHCDKCVRTIGELMALGYESDTFPDKSSHKKRLAFTAIRFPDMAIFYEEMISEALRRKDYSTVRAAGFALTRLNVSMGLKATLNNIDRVVLGGRIARKRHSRSHENPWHGLM